MDRKTLVNLIKLSEQDEMVKEQTLSQLQSQWYHASDQKTQLQHYIQSSNYPEFSKGASDIQNTQAFLGQINHAVQQQDILLSQLVQKKQSAEKELQGARISTQQLKLLDERLETQKKVVLSQREQQELDAISRSLKSSHHMVH